MTSNNLILTKKSFHFNCLLARNFSAMKWRKRKQSLRAIPRNGTPSVYENG